jgi:hypothetical protein
VLVREELVREVLREVLVPYLGRPAACALRRAPG